MIWDAVAYQRLEFPLGIRFDLYQRSYGLVFFPRFGQATFNLFFIPQPSVLGHSVSDRFASLAR